MKTLLVLLSLTTYLLKPSAANATHSPPTYKTITVCESADTEMLKLTIQKSSDPDNYPDRILFRQGHKPTIEYIVISGPLTAMSTVYAYSGRLSLELVRLFGDYTHSVTIDNFDDGSKVTRTVGCYNPEPLGALNKHTKRSY